MCWNKGRLYWKIAKLFHLCHLKQLVRPETFGPTAVMRRANSYLTEVYVHSLKTVMTVASLHKFHVVTQSGSQCRSIGPTVNQLQTDSNKSRGNPCSQLLSYYMCTTVAYRGGGLGFSNSTPPPPKFRIYRWSPRTHEQEEPASRFPFVVHCVLIRL